MTMSVSAETAPHTDTDSLSAEVEIASTRMENKIVEKPPKLLYIEVTDAEETKSRCTGGQRPSFRYTRSLLQSTLQLMGCKPRHAFKISKHVIEVLRYQSSSKEHLSKDQYRTQNVSLEGVDNIGGSFIKEHANCSSGKDKDDDNENKPFQVYKRQTTLTVGREVFLDVICDALSEYKYVGPNQRADLILACRIREHRDSVTILLCGTSGCGKSTLSALLASRLGITTVVSTDSIRHMMRGFTSEEESPLLFASTYHAGECLDPISVAAAKAKKKSKKLSSNFEDSSSAKTQASEPLQSSKGAENNNGSDIIGPKALAVEGYKAQSEMVIDSLDRLITSWEEKKESVVIEGVHLSLSFVMGLMKKHPSIIPFMIYIASEEKHLERFAVRAKYMTLDPAKNKYVKYIRNIRAIQDYLCKRADKHLVPKVNNTNVDKSVAAIHATVFSCLRRRNGGEQLYDSATNTASVVEEEYRSQCTSYSITSKGMLQLIQRKGSHPHLMALVNIDGSLAKAWPYESDNSANKYSVVKDLVKAELVNLQFGNFGLGSWAADIGGTSHANSIDGSRIDSNDTSSHYYSSCSSTPRFSDGRSTKEQAEDDDNILQYSTEEEPDEIPDVDSDEDLKGNKEDEMEGSVDEGSERSDDEYDEDMVIDEEEDQEYYSDSPGKENVVSNVVNSVKCHSLGLPPHDSRVENYYQNVGSHCLELEPQLVSYAHFKELSNNCSI